mmetsp:Transcript_62667/g.162633  ORF Transcript_62667/g.162633 Transcript_62667/m.162633 type:complete len:299 (+) Transcript_62667:57-953(+)
MRFTHHGGHRKRKKRTARHKLPGYSQCLQDLGLVLKLVYQVIDGVHLDATSACWGLFHLEDLQTRCKIDAKGLGIQNLHGLLLGLHEVREGCITRLVQAEVGRDDTGQRALDLLDAAVHLPSHRDEGLALINLHLRGGTRLRPTHQSCKHRSCLVAVVVDRLLPEENHRWVFLLYNFGQQLGHMKRLQLLVGPQLRLDVNSAVCSHSESLAQGLRGFIGAARYRDQLFEMTLLLQAQPLLDCDLTKWVHGHLDTVCLDSALVRLDTHLDCIVHHALDCNYSPHCWEATKALADKIGPW